MQRFFLNNQNSKNVEKSIVIYDIEIINQITKVLRLKPKDHIICLFNNGFEYELCIQLIEKKKIETLIIEKRENKNELHFDLTLIQSLPKSKDIWENIVKKATELGVKDIYPLKSSRTTGKYPTYTQRTNKIIKEAAEQSERGILPIIHDIIDIQKPLNSFLKGIKLFVGDSYNNKNKHLIDYIKDDNERNKSYGIIIGPEGGFSEEEIDLFKRNEVIPVSFGNRKLKVETAAVFGLSLLSSIKY